MPDAFHIGLIGSRFMGKAHSNAWLCVHRFFEDLPVTPTMHVVCARDPDSTRRFADRWGWTHSTTDATCVIEDPEVDLVDLCTPNDRHHDHAIAALEQGRHVACEKPLSHTLETARAMRDAARGASRRGILTFVWFNYRRCPAIALAHRLVNEGRLGAIRHVRARYLQDWGGPSTPMSWRFDRARAGSGAHGDLNTHLIDLTRFITGDEIVTINGAIAHRFIASRPRVDSKTGRPKKTKHRSTVDDAMLFLATMRGGATASFEASRVATGHQNRNVIEINGELGSLSFDFERMNELLWWDETIEPALRGWSRLLCTTPEAHAYVDAYWPPGHLIGYEHGFISQAADMLRAIHGQVPTVPLADFDDAYQTQRVLDAVMRSAEEGTTIELRDVT